METDLSSGLTIVRIGVVNFRALKPWGLPEDPQEVKQMGLWEPPPTANSVGGPP